MAKKYFFNVTKKLEFFILAAFFCSFTAAFAQPGELDTSFNSGKGASGFVETIALQPDGKILIGGSFTTYDKISRNRIARINADGTLDASFKPAKGVDGNVETISIQSDKKIVVAGTFTNYNGAQRPNIARINADGTIDPTFNSGIGPDNFLLSTFIQSDGKIIIGGGFNNYNGTPRNRIARLNSDGTIDTSFDPGKGTDKDVFAIAVEPDGKIIIGGNFKSYNGTTVNRIARLNTDGTLDKTFNSGVGTDEYVGVITLQSDGKIILGGAFTSYNGTQKNHIVRLNPDGTIDPTFNSGTGTNDYVGTISFQTDGKLIVGGNFTFYNGIPVNHLVRVNTDGILDTTFDTGKGINKNVSTTTIQADGKLLIGGEFTTYNGTASNYIARIKLKKLKPQK